MHTHILNFLRNEGQSVLPNSAPKKDTQPPVLRSGGDQASLGPAISPPLPSLEEGTSIPCTMSEPNITPKQTAKPAHLKTQFRTTTKVSLTQATPSPNQC